jgi:hypothetical protein
LRSSSSRSSPGSPSSRGPERPRVP